MTVCVTVGEQFNAPAADAKGPGFRREAERINAEHDAVVGAEREALLHAIRAGQLLLDVKRRVPHGDFLAWVGANCRFKVRTAQLYMALARELSSKCATVSHLGLRDALALVRVPRAQPPWLGLKRLTVTLEFESSETHARYWDLLRALHARGDPVPTILRALEALIESQSFVDESA